METVETVSKMRSLASRLRAGKAGLSLVPTMGALHAGHEALISAAVSGGGRVVVSIFVNPLSFGTNENYSDYPRSLEADVALCARLGADAVFAPSADEIYPRGYSTYVSEESYSKALCGISRPSHFRGVTTLVAKLLNIIGPKRLYVGQKDAQHITVLRKMAADLNYAVDFVVIPTVREADGLALAVRNRDLSASLREEALAVNRSLKRAKDMVDSGVRSADRLVAEVTHILSRHNRIRVIHASIVDPDTMETMREVVPGRTLLSIAAWADEIRLTDNTML